MAISGVVKVASDATSSSQRETVRPVVCLPTRNEEPSVARMVHAIRALGYDVFICDERSTDETCAIAASLGVSVHQRAGSGKGWGVRKALEIAVREGYDVLVLIDCDCSYSPEEIPRLLSAMNRHGCVIGSRPMHMIPWPNRFVNYLHTGAVNLLFGVKLHDINSGLRVLRVKSYVDVLTATGFDIEAQMTIVALTRRLGITEVPIGYHKRVGHSKVRVWDVARILWRIIRERFHPR